jgi:hypothetical protein
MKDDDAKHELVKAKATKPEQSRKKAPQRSQPETPWKLIRRAWYTTFSRAPARMDGLCRCTVREFSLQRCSFGPVDVLMTSPNPYEAPGRRSVAQSLPTGAPQPSAGVARGDDMALRIFGGAGDLGLAQDPAVSSHVAYRFGTRLLPSVGHWAAALPQSGGDLRGLAVCSSAVPGAAISLRNTDHRGRHCHRGAGGPVFCLNR